MNLFLTGWNMPKALAARAMAALKDMAGIYPQLDTQNAWQAEHGSIYVTAMQTLPNLCGPRRYVSNDDQCAVFYDGLAVDKQGKFKAHDADELKEHWQYAREHLQGQFVLVRADFENQSLEVVTDWLGMFQVYWSRRRNWWMISNNARLIVNITGEQELDPLGAGMYLTMNRPWDDRTLYKLVRVMPGGQRWIFRPGRHEPAVSTYYSPSRLARRYTRSADKSDIEQLARELSKPCIELAKHFPLQCPITGGKDSRVLVALMQANNINAEYITEGESDSADVEIARMIANKHKLDHTVAVKQTADIVDMWDACVERIISRCDGMVSIWQLADVMEAEPQEYKILLSGLGGEVARGYYYDPLDAVRKLTVDDVLDRLAVSNYEGLVNPDVVTEVSRHTRQYVERCFDLGHRHATAIDIFYLYEPTRRWGGTNLRKNAWRGDAFVPLLDRSFAEASFSMPPGHRCCAALHKQLLKLLEPSLLKFPLDRGRWPCRSPRLNLLMWTGTKLLKRMHLQPKSRRKRRTPVFDHRAWLDARLQWMREVCLGRSSSPIWRFINRPVLEKLLSGSNWQGSDDMLFAVYMAATLFNFEAGHTRSARLVHKS